MKPVVLVSVLLAASAAVLAAPASDSGSDAGPEPYSGDSSESAATVTTSAASGSSSQAPGNAHADSRDGIRDKKSAPCDDATNSATSAKSKDSNLQERTKGTHLVSVQVPATKTKFVKVPVQPNIYAHGHYAYGGHRADEWSQQNFASPDQERFAYADDADFQAYQRASQQQMAAAAMQAEMAARAEARMEELRLATEREAEITARQQALASEQQLTAAAIQAEMAAMASAQAHARAAELAQQEKIQQEEQALQQSIQIQKDLAEMEAMESAQQMQHTSARSAYEGSYAPLSVPFSGYPRAGAAVGYFPRSPVSNNCGGIPLLFGCSPTLVRGNLVGGHGYSGGGGGGAYGASGFGYGSGYQLGPLIGASLSSGGGYRQAGDSEVFSGIESGKIVIDLSKMNLKQRSLMVELMKEFGPAFNGLSNSEPTTETD